MFGDTESVKSKTDKVNVVVQIIPPSQVALTVIVWLPRAAVEVALTVKFMEPEVEPDGKLICPPPVTVTPLGRAPLLLISTLAGVPLPAARLAVTVWPVIVPPLSIVRLGTDKEARLKTERLKFALRVMPPPMALIVIV
jgi:hypothetical protein